MTRIAKKYSQISLFVITGLLFTVCSLADNQIKIYTAPRGALLNNERSSDRDNWLICGFSSMKNIAPHPGEVLKTFCLKMSLIPVKMLKYPSFQVTIRNVWWKMWFLKTWWLTAIPFMMKWTANPVGIKRRTWPVFLWGSIQKMSFSGRVSDF